MRFMPSLVVLFMIFMSSLPKKLASGPQMSDLDEEQKECRESWLRSMLMMGNLNSAGKLVRNLIKEWKFSKLFLIFPFSVPASHLVHIHRLSTVYLIALNYFRFIQIRSKFPQNYRIYCPRGTD